MSGWSFGRDDDRQNMNHHQYGWHEDPGWNFDPLDDDDWYDGDGPFAGLHDAFSNSREGARSSFTNTAAHLREPHPLQRRTGDTSHAHDSSFLDDILEATAPRRRRPQHPSEPALTQRHPTDQPREAYRPPLPSFANRHHHSDHRNQPNQQQSHFGYIPSALFEASDSDDPTPFSTQPSTRVSDRASEEFVTLEDDTDEEPEAMPPARRRTNNRASGTIDLTSGATAASSAQGSRGRKRSADSTVAAEGPAFKRGRISQEDIEEIDLSKSADEVLLQQQQQEALKQQQAGDAESGPVKIGQRTCIICMENFTNCTIASCGHFYCHECLIQALLAGEKNSDRGHGTCPQCRKPLSRNNKKKRDVIPLSFMKKATFQKNQEKRLQA